MYRIRRLTLAILLGVLISTLSSSLVSAGAPIGDTLTVFDDPEEEKSPAIAYNPDRREYLVVWHNDRPAHDDIRARLVSEDGTPLGDAFYIAGGSTLMEQRYPDVVYNSRMQEYLVVWQRSLSWWPMYYITTRRVSETGQLIGTSESQVFGSSGKLSRPSVAYASTTNQYLVVCHEDNSGNVDDIMGILLSYKGIYLDSFYISFSPGINDKLLNPDVAYNPSRNEFLVVWELWDDSAGESDIYARRVRGDGTPMHPGEIPIVTGGIGDQHQRRPVVASLPTETHQGEYLVVWEDHWKIDDIDIWARRVDGEGNPVDAKFPITVAEGNQQSPALAGKESSKNYLLVWRHQEPGMLNTFIRGREITIDARFLGEEREMGVFTSENPAVASGVVDFLVVFDDIMPFSDSSGIFGSLWGNRIYLPLVRR